jgi:hypothetical protein
MLADVNTYYTEKPLLRSAKLLSLTMAAILFPRAFSHGPFPTGLFPRAFSHGPFPTGGRQRLLSRQGRFATEIRPDRNSRPSLFVFPLSTQH